MKRKHLFLPIALLQCSTIGCSDRTTQNQHIGATEEAQLSVQAQAGDAEAARKLKQLQKARDVMLKNEPIVAPDIRDGWEWPAEEIAALTKLAKAGDIAAADRLHQYYSVHEDEANIAYWEDWLFKHGDPGAIKIRAQQIYSVAQERSPTDPRKLKELKEAERLWQSATVGRTDNPFLDTLRSKIASIEGSN